MYQFKLDNGNLVDEVGLDGYSIGDLALEGITIHLKMDDEKYVHTYFDDADLLSLHGLEYQTYLQEAQSIAQFNIENNYLDDFITQSKNKIIDIVDQNKESYYRQSIPFIKEIFHLKIEPLCSQSLLKNIERKT